MGGGQGGQTRRDRHQRGKGPGAAFLSETGRQLSKVRLGAGEGHALGGRKEPSGRVQRQEGDRRLPEDGGGEEGQGGGEEKERGAAGGRHGLQDLGDQWETGW